MTLLPFLAALGCAGVIWLGVATWKAAGRRMAARSAYFSAVEPLFDRVTAREEPSGFPRMTARIGADAFDLQALTDSLTFRKLPALWVMLTLPAPLPVRATLDIMARPGGLETFSQFHSLPHTLPTLPGLPEGTVIRSDDAGNVPPDGLVTPHLGLFADPRIKELVISPRGLRIVFLAEEAERGRYLIFRDAELGAAPLSPERLKPLIDTLLSLRDSLMEAA